MSFKHVLIIIVIVIANVNCQELSQDQERIKQLKDKHRCSRRFTPGVCLDNVAPVWTFEYQIMNCTERLGCPQAIRTNRFSSYRLCMRRCEPLVDLYMQILSYGGENETRFFLRESPGMQIRRDGSKEVSINLPEPLDPEEEQYSGDEAIMSILMYGENDNEDTDNRDVDRVEVARDPADYFGVH